MFTGLIQTLGTVRANESVASGRRLVIEPPVGFPTQLPGASIAVHGCCLTLVAGEGSALRFDVIPQTLALTTIGDLGAGATIHLEISATPSTLLGGHLVLGHIDGVAVVREISVASGEHRVTLEAPIEVAEAMVAQGSVTLDGVSLTIATVHGGASAAALFDVCLIPETLARTTLSRWRVGSRVNLEADYLAKLVAACVKRAR